MKFLVTLERDEAGFIVAECPKEAVIVRHVVAFTLISWTLIYAVPPSKSGRDGLVSQRGMKGGYPSEAACQSAAQVRKRNGARTART
jgi:hypothetical protein